MSDRTNNRIRELLAQSRALWAICERFDEISFELRALAPLTLQPGETDRLTHQKHRLSAGVTLLQRRRAAILNHILLTLSRHHVLQNTMRQHVLTTACRELIHAQRYGLGVDGNAPLSQMIREFDQIRAAQQMSAMRSLVMRLELALIASPGYHPHRTHPLQPEELSPHTAMMCTLMAYDAYPHDYPDVSSTEFCHFVAYHYAHATLTSARTISVRDLVPEGATSGIAGTAFIFSGQRGEQVFINFRGAERTGKNGEWLETARDWTYMLSAVLLGRGGEADQLPHARTFMHRLQNELAPGAEQYGLGHSLGGQLIQALQVLDHPFKSATVINAVPMQIRQLERLAPARFTPAQWQTLHDLCDDVNGATDLEPTLRQFGEPASDLTHRTFDHDFTALFTWTAGTATIGVQQHYTLRDWYYPFTGRLDRFLAQDELSALAQFVQMALARLQNANSAGQMASQLMTFASSLTITLFRHLNQQPVVQFLNHVMAFLYASGIFTTPPQPLTLDSGTRHASWRGILMNLTRERTFFTSLNRPLLDTMTTMHIVSGAKFLVTGGPTHWPVIRVTPSHPAPRVDPAKHLLRARLAEKAE